MGTQQTFVMVPEEDFAALRSEIRALRNQINGAIITPRAEWISIAEAAKAKGVNRSTIHRWIASGKLEARGSGRLRQVKTR